MTVQEQQSQSDQQQSSVDWSKGLVCKSCRLTITHSDFIIEKSGRSEHLQVNPQGLTFIFRTYSRAVGICESGEPTEQYSWFTGYRWQFALCQGCQTHLGWRFVGQDSFFGLLNDKLVTKS